MRKKAIKSIIMESTRQQKINKLIQRDLGTIFQLESRSIIATAAMITVTKVTVSRDMSSVRVFLSIFALEDKVQLMKAIQEKSATFRMLLGQKVRNQLRVTPELIFELDDSLDYAEKIDKLLKG